MTANAVDPATAPVGAAGGGLTGTYPNPGLSAAAMVAGMAGQAMAPGAITTASVFTANGGTNTSGNAPTIAAPGFANGTASQLSDLTRDYVVYITITTAGTLFTLSIGPTAGVANAIVPSSTVSLGESFTIRLPAGWFLKWSATLATVSQIAIGC